MVTESIHSTPELFEQLKFKDDFLKQATFKKLQLIESTLAYRGNSRTNKDSNNKSSHYSCEADEQFFQSKLLVEIVNAFSDLVAKKLKVRRAIFRRSQFGEYNEIHQDFFITGHEQQFFTGVLFLNNDWHLDWRGEFSVVDVTRGTSFSVYPKQNRALIFPSHLSHTVSPPSRECYESRTVLVLNMHEDAS